MPSPDRQILADRQAQLVQALNQGGRMPAGFDERRMTLAADSLRRKRRRSVEKVWPALCSALGDQFATTFDAYAWRYPPQNPSADARQFARWLANLPGLSDRVRVRLAAARLMPLLPVILRLREARRWVVLIRWKDRVLQLPLPPGRSWTNPLY